MDGVGQSYLFRLASRICSAVLVSLACVAVLVGIGVTAYGVDMLWAKIPAALVTLVVGIGCFAALGLALVALTHTALAARTLSNGLLIPLAFIANVFIVGADLPETRSRRPGSPSPRSASAPCCR